MLCSLGLGVMTPILLLNIIIPGLVGPLGLAVNGLALWTLLRSPTLSKRNATIFLISIFVADLFLNLNRLVLWIPAVCRINVASFYKPEKITFLQNSSDQDTIKTYLTYINF